MKQGFVALIGAGPGDKGLLTIKGAGLLSKAEVVVYDRLVSEDILKLIPAGAEKIDVGKESSHHPVKQEGINELLLKKALEGKCVIRLKGGDPFVFGRGGEELELLVKNNIPFEVVPGITSAVAALAYAGIPATHRDFCSSIHIITGHARTGKELTIPFKAITELKGTLVFLMGVSSLGYIMKGLLEAGMESATPAAVIENGTRTNQRKIMATVATLEQKAMEYEIKSPAVIAVGQVCTLSDSFDWFMKKPLFGKKVLVTRPKAAHGILSEKLYGLGAEPIDYPCIEVVPIQNNTPFYKACENLGRYSWILFTSRNGVDIFFDYLNTKGLDARVLAGIRIAVVGSQTAQALKERGIFSDYIPEIFDGEHLAQGVAQLADKEKKILICDAALADEHMADIFNSRKVPFDRVSLYDTHYVNEGAGHVKELIAGGRLKYVTFTSASTVEGFALSMGNADLSGITGICIGHQTAKTAAKHNIKHVISNMATVDSIIDKLLEVVRNDE